MSAPVVVTAYFRPAPGEHDRVVEALRSAIAAVHEEPGCKSMPSTTRRTAPLS